MATLIIDNFQGRLTRYKNGDINSGYAKYATTFGNDPFSKPGDLTWFEVPTRIDSGGSVITDLIMAARPRLESNITYVYAIGHLGRLYKIQVNDPSSNEPDHDNPVLLTTLTAESPTFKFGASIEFFGDTERLFIGHDRGVTRIDFNGTNETFVGTQSNYTSGVPRPSEQFVGNLYFGDGDNIMQITSALTATHDKLSPPLFVGTQVRDLDVSPDGNYLQIVSTRVTQADMTTATQDTDSLSSADSNLFLWNGIDIEATARTPYNSYSLTANETFGPFSYTMGYDLGGATIYTEGQKILSLPNSIAPNFNSMFSTGNLVGFASPEHNDTTDVLEASMLVYGAYDLEIPQGLYRWFRLTAATETDVIQVPMSLIVSNLFFGSSSAGYTDNKIGSAKLYFSTHETDSSPTSDFKLYRFTTVPTGADSAIAGVYETQNQLFPQKMKIAEVRLYTDPIVTNNAFTIALIGSDGNIITNSSKTFTAGTEVAVGEDLCKYSPVIEPTYAIGVRITNSGSVNMTFNKIEIDYAEGGR